MAKENRFQIVELSRHTKTGVKEYIRFSGGVNLIEGGPNTGKTTWLQCLNFLLGAEKRVEHYFSDNFLKKYRSIQAEIQLHNESINLKRDWTLIGGKSKVIGTNGKTYSGDEFQRELFQLLNIPNLKYPKSDPISEIKATTLSFRMHYRHLYRQQRFWNDLVDRQHAGEFRSCLLNFLGLAEKIYTDEYYKYYDLSDALKDANEKYANNKEILDLVFHKVFNDSTLSGESLTLSVVEDFLHYLESEMLKKLEELRTEEENSLNEGKMFYEDYLKIIEHYKEIGRLEEKILIYNNIEPIVNNLKEAHSSIQEITDKKRPYYQFLRNLGDTLDINSSIQLLCDAMNEYLQRLNSLVPKTWKHRPVNMIVNRNYINIRIGVHPWSSVLGGTDSLYFFLSYHYGLLAISNQENTRIPSLVVIDFPPDIQGIAINENQNFVIQPYIDLLKDQYYSHCQVIFAGNSFNSLTGCHKHKMTNTFFE